MAGTNRTSVAGGVGILAASLVVIVAAASCGADNSTSNTSALGVGGGSETSTSSTSQSSKGAGATSIAQAATPAPTQAPPPPVVATATPVPLRTDTCGAPANPWGYGFCQGSVIYNVPAGFCDYFNCIPSFGGSSGYIVECVDGQYSNAGGRSGACSHHGGEARALLQP